jgi:hypothetical protein
MTSDPELERLLEAKNAAGQRWGEAYVEADLARLAFDDAEDAYDKYKAYNAYKEYKEKLT